LGKNARLVFRHQLGRMRNGANDAVAQRYDGHADAAFRKRIKHVT
jgi:hypothetical protein